MNDEQVAMIVAALLVTSERPVTENTFKSAVKAVLRLLSTDPRTWDERECLAEEQ